MSAVALLAACSGGGTQSTTVTTTGTGTATGTTSPQATLASQRFAGTGPGGIPEVVVSGTATTGQLDGSLAGSLDSYGIIPGLSGVFASSGGRSKMIGTLTGTVTRGASGTPESVYGSMLGAE